MQLVLKGGSSKKDAIFNVTEASITAFRNLVKDGSALQLFNVYESSYKPLFSTKKQNTVGKEPHWYFGDDITPNNLSWAQDKLRILQRALKHNSPVTAVIHEVPEHIFADIRKAYDLTDSRTDTAQTCSFLLQSSGAVVPAHVHMSPHDLMIHVVEGEGLFSSYLRNPQHVH
jgi:hypothetical protein